MAGETFEERLRTLLEAYSLPGRRITFGAQQPLVFLKNDAGHALLIANNVVPTPGVAGYAKGCIFIKTDALTTVRALYENVGTTASCSFIVVGRPRTADIDLTTGKILYGVTNVAAERTLSLTPDPISVSCMYEFLAPAAAAVAVHAAVAESDPNTFPGPFTDPVIPRTLDVVFAAGWQGGDIIVDGTNQFDVVIQETFTSNPGATVNGVKVFKTVTGAAKTVTAGAADTATLQTGGAIGILNVIADTFGWLTMDGVMEAVTLDATYASFTPTTAPNGVHNYHLLVNVRHLHTLVYS